MTSRASRRSSGRSTSCCRRPTAPQAVMKESDSSPEPGPDVERTVLGELPVFTAFDIADQTGVDVEEARRFWRALGFPTYGLETAFTPADAEALSTIHRVVESGLIDLDTAVNLTRGVGQTMA